VRAEAVGRQPGFEANTVSPGVSNLLKKLDIHEQGRLNPQKALDAMEFLWKYIVARSFSDFPI